MRASVVQNIDSNRVLFNIWVTPQLELREVPKESILSAVHKAYYMGLSTMSDLNDSVVDARKIDIFSKLYLMGMNEKLQAWINQYDDFMKKPLRNHAEQTQLLNDYTMIVTGIDMGTIDKELYKKADDCASRLQLLHV